MKAAAPSTLKAVSAEAQKSFPFVNGLQQDMINFDLSTAGEIDSSKYSLFDLLSDERVFGARFESRIEMMNSWINDLKDKNHYMYQRTLDYGCKPVVSHLDNQEGPMKLINLASNDYLNLTQHPRIIKSVQEVIEEHGVGTGGVPLLSGTTSISKALENKIAAMKGCEAAMVYSSGYGANLGTIASLMRDKDLVIYDRFAHASLVDGGMNAGTKKFFAHNDPGSLEQVLKATQGQYANTLVVLDGVYSMDGDVARLDEILAMAHRYGAWVLVDEAHATGVIGAHGKGTLEYYGLEGKVDIVTGTLSKAVGGVGGYVAGSRQLIQYLNWASRSYMFSTAPMIATCVAASEALDIIVDEPELRLKLWENIVYVHDELVDAGFDLGNSETAIIPIIVKDDFKTKEMAYRLHRAGIYVNPVPYPAVPRRLSRVRLSLTSGNTLDELSYVVEQIKAIGKDMGII